MTKTNPFTIIVGIIITVIFVIVQIIIHYWYVILIMSPIIWYFYQKRKKNQVRIRHEQIRQEQVRINKEHQKEQRLFERYQKEINLIEARYQKQYEKLEEMTRRHQRRLEQEYRKQFEQYQKHLEREFWQKWNEYKSGEYDFEDVFGGTRESYDEQDFESEAFSSVNYYDVLQVSKSASFTEIKNQFRKLILKYHPDRNNSSEASKISIALYEAYKVLSDPEKRAQYDNYINDKM